MAGKGFLPPKPGQTRRSVHFRLDFSSFRVLEEYCRDRDMKKQELLEGITRALLRDDSRLQEIVEEVLAERKLNRGLDDTDREEIQGIFESESPFDL